jgi:hypothetical protein
LIGHGELADPDDASSLGSIKRKGHGLHHWFVFIFFYFKKSLLLWAISRLSVFLGMISGDGSAGAASSSSSASVLAFRAAPAGDPGSTLDESTTAAALASLSPERAAELDQREGALREELNALRNERRSAVRAQVSGHNGERGMANSLFPIKPPAPPPVQ